MYASLLDSIISVPSGFSTALRIVPIILDSAGNIPLVVLNNSQWPDVITPVGSTSVFSPKVFYSDAINCGDVLSNGTAVGATPTTSVDLSNFVPSEAKYVTLEVTGQHNDDCEATEHTIGFISGSVHAKLTTNILSRHASLVVEVPSTTQRPMVGAPIIYYNNSSSGGVTSIRVLGYECGWEL